MGIRGGQIQDGTVEGIDIKDGTLGNADFASDAAIDQSKISQTGGWINNISVDQSTWKKIDNPSTDWLAYKTSGWTPDSFSGGLLVDFSSVVPVGTKAVRVYVQRNGSAAAVYYRKYNDVNIPNAPAAGNEYSHRILGADPSDVEGGQCVIWLSNDYKAEFAMASSSSQLYVASPTEYTTGIEPDMAGSVPIGAVLPWAGGSAPDGYLLNNGGEYSRTTYSDLFTEIGTDYGVGDGSTTFNVPKSDYDSGWISTSGLGAGNNVIITHGLFQSIDNLEYQLLFRNSSIPDAIYNGINGVYSAGDYGQIIQGLSTGASSSDLLNKLKIQVGNISGRYISTSGAGVDLPITGWEYKMIVERKDMPKGSIIRAENVSIITETLTSAIVADLTVTNSTNFQTGVTVPVMHIQDQKAANVDGGTSSEGLNIRVLNTVLTNTITGASLSANQITLPAGTYLIDIHAPVYAGNRFYVQLYNVTDATEEVQGLNATASSMYPSTIHALLKNIITTTGTKIFEVRHYIDDGAATYGLGIASNTEVGNAVEIYTDVFIEKLA